jgi:hypothetical protein
MSDYDEAVKINNYLKTLEHNLHNQPIFRLVQASDQWELRNGVFNEFKGELYVRTVRGVKRTPKYPQLKDTYIIERWFPPKKCQTEDIKDHNGYECIYAFRDAKFNRLPLRLDAVQFFIKKMREYVSPMRRKSLMNDYLIEKERIADQYTYDAIDPSSPIESALHFKEGVSLKGLDIPGGKGAKTECNENSTN